MKKEHEITTILDQLQAAEGEHMAINREAVVATYQKINANRSNTVIKVLIVIGGFLATLAFIGFLVVAGLYHSEAGLIIIGTSFITGAIWVSKAFDLLILDAIAVTAFATGLFLLSYGLGGLRVHENMVCIVLIFVGIGTLAIVQNYILAFLAVLTINGSIMALIMMNNQYNLLHIYIAMAVVALTLFMLNEAELITGGDKLSRLNNPIRLGLVFSLVAAYIFVSTRGLLRFSIHFNLVSSIAAITAILYFLPRLLKLLTVTNNRIKAAVYVGAILVLLPSLYAPAIPGAILITVLSFWINYKTGLSIGIIALVYFIGRYYYDLQLTLLTKSILLFASGILFILFYLLTNKKLEQHEKI